MRVSRVSFFFFILTYNYLLLRAIIFPYLYNNYGVNGYIYIGIILFIVLLFFLALPKKVIDYNLLEKYKNSKLKYLFNTILLLRIVFGAYYGAMTIGYLFFKNTNYYILAFGLFLLIYILSSLKPSDVIQISTLFGIVILIIYLTYMLGNVSPDFSMLYLFYDFKILPYIFIFPILLIGDNILLLLCNKDDFVFSKKTFSFGIFVTFLFFCFEYVNLVLTSGDIYYKNMEYLGFVPLQIKSVSRYLGSFEYVYILLITASSVFKFSYFFSIVKESYSFKKINENIVYILIILFISLLVLFINYYNLFVNVLTIFVGVCFFMLIFIINNVYIKKE